MAKEIYFTTTSGNSVKRQMNLKSLHMNYLNRLIGERSRKCHNKCVFLMDWR